MGFFIFVIALIILSGVMAITLSTNATSFTGSLIAGNEQYGNKTCVIKLLDNKLIISELFKKEPFLIINKEDIENINSYSQEASTEQDKSVIGRAVVGGVLLGPVGAIVGGMSGIGTKNKSKREFYFSVKTKNNQDLLFKLNDAGISITARSIQKKLSCVS